MGVVLSTSSIIAIAAGGAAFIFTIGCAATVFWLRLRLRRHPIPPPSSNRVASFRGIPNVSRKRLSAFYYPEPHRSRLHSRTRKSLAEYRRSFKDKYGRCSTKSDNNLIWSGVDQIESAKAKLSAPKTYVKACHKTSNNIAEASMSPITEQTRAESPQPEESTSIKDYAPPVPPLNPRRIRSLSESKVVPSIRAQQVEARNTLASRSSIAITTNRQQAVTAPRDFSGRGGKEATLHQERSWVFRNQAPGRAPAKPVPSLPDFSIQAFEDELVKRDIAWPKISRDSIDTVTSIDSSILNPSTILAASTNFQSTVIRYPLGSRDKRRQALSIDEAKKFDWNSFVQGTSSNLEQRSRPLSSAQAPLEATGQPTLPRSKSSALSMSLLSESLTPAKNILEQVERAAKWQDGSRPKPMSRNLSEELAIDTQTGEQGLPEIVTNGKLEASKLARKCLTRPLAETSGNRLQPPQNLSGQRRKELGEASTCVHQSGIEAKSSGAHQSYQTRQKHISPRIGALIAAVDRSASYRELPSIDKDEIRKSLRPGLEIERLSTSSPRPPSTQIFNPEISLSFPPYCDRRRSLKQHRVSKTPPQRHTRLSSSELHSVLPSKASNKDLFDPEAVLSTPTKDPSQKRRSNHLDARRLSTSSTSHLGSPRLFPLPSPPPPPIFHHRASPPLQWQVSQQPPPFSISQYGIKTFVTEPLPRSLDSIPGEIGQAIFTDTPPLESSAVETPVPPLPLVLASSASLRTTRRRGMVSLGTKFRSNAQFQATVARARVQGPRSSPLQRGIPVSPHSRSGTAGWDTVAVGGRLASRSSTGQEPNSSHGRGNGDGASNDVGRLWDVFGPYANPPLSPSFEIAEDVTASHSNLTRP